MLYLYLVLSYHLLYLYLVLVTIRLIFTLFKLPSLQPKQTLILRHELRGIPVASRWRPQIKYSMCSRFLLEKLLVPQLVQK